MHLQPECDIAVVGAGPVGLTVALLLKQYGHNVKVLERHPRAYGLPRAVGLDHQSMRMYDGLGLGTKLFTSGATEPFTCKSCELVSSAEEVLTEIPFNQTLSTSGTKEAFALHQPTLEQVLEEECEARNILILRGYEVENVMEMGSYVAITMGLSEGEGRKLYQPQTITAQFVIGCDGARSVVRESSGIKFQRLPGRRTRWLVVDILPTETYSILDWKDGTVPRHYFDPKRPRSSCPGGEIRRRFEFMVHPEESDEMVLSDDFIWMQLASFACGTETAVIERRTVYRLEGAWAETWNKGRVLLAGDAAHVTPQFTGQGLNGGLRDAHSLCWRLDFALRHPAVNLDSLFASYTAEQMGPTKQFVTTAIGFEGMFTLSDEAAAAARDKVLKEGAPVSYPDVEALGSPGLYDESAELIQSAGVGGKRRETGRLFIRDQVELNSQIGWLDQIIGSGWQLLGIGPGDPSRLLTPETKARFEEHLGGISASFTGDGACQDLRGRYKEWFAQRGAKAVLVRPDFYVYGMAYTDSQVETLVFSALDRLWPSSTNICGNGKHL